MNSIDLVSEHLDALGLRYRRVSDGELIDISFNGENVVYEGTISVRGSLVTIIAYNVLVVPRPRLDETIRVVNLINSRRTSYGAFWVNTERLRVAFELPIAAPDGLTQEQVSMAMSALGQIDDFYPVLGAVIWGGMTAEQAMTPPEPRETPSSETEDEGPSLDIAV